MYRMFVDEVGHDTLKRLDHSQNRFLSLTGAIIDEAIVCAEVRPRIDDIKTDILRDPALILHRREIVSHTGSFDCLRDEGVCRQFEEALLDMYSSVPYLVITVLIDKQEFSDRYVFKVNPYHYCLELLLERYAWQLEAFNTTGDVVCEVRGEREDRALAAAYSSIWTNGNVFCGANYMTGANMQARLSTRELKLKPKSANDPGLQFVDMLANPCHRNTLSVHGLGDPPLNLSKDLVAVLEDRKYRRNAAGRIDGFGRKKLP